MTEFIKWIETYEDTPACNGTIIKAFEQKTNEIPELKAHRDFIEESQFRFGMIYGHGHRSLQYLWKLLVDQMPETFSFLEIGVYKGQILSLIEMLAGMSQRKPTIVGITPLFDPEFANYNRAEYISNIYKQFKLNTSNTYIYDGRSQEEKMISSAKCHAPYDMVYIDGDHSYEATKFDIKTYGAMIKQGGFLIIDDCSTYKNLPDETFSGIVTVSDAVRDTVEIDKSFKELLTCMHVRVWQCLYDHTDLTDEEFWALHQ